MMMLNSEAFVRAELAYRTEQSLAAHRLGDVTRTRRARWHRRRGAVTGPVPSTMAGAVPASAAIGGASVGAVAGQRARHATAGGASIVDIDHGAHRPGAAA